MFKLKFGNEGKVEANLIEYKVHENEIVFTLEGGAILTVPHVRQDICTKLIKSKVIVIKNSDVSLIDGTITHYQPNPFVNDRSKSLSKNIKDPGMTVAGKKFTAGIQGLPENCSPELKEKIMAKIAADLENSGDMKAPTGRGRK